jgi:hypothetical protein
LFSYLKIPVYTYVMFMQIFMKNSLRCLDLCDTSVLNRSNIIDKLLEYE